MSRTFHANPIVISASLCILLICSGWLPAQTSQGASVNRTPRFELKDYEQFAAYWTGEAGWQSELQLRNNMSDRDLTVSPVVRTADGAETSLPVVTVKPAEVKSIDIVESAPQLAGRYGSILLRYRALGLHSLYAAVMMRDLGHPIAFHLDAVPEVRDFDGVSREGIYWLPNGAAADYLVVTNQSGRSVNFELSLYDAAGKISYGQTLRIGPRQTSRYSVRSLLRSPVGATYGGIKILAPTHSGSIDSVHFIFDEQAGFSALLKMFDYNPRATVAQRDHAKTDNAGTDAGIVRS